MTAQLGSDKGSASSRGIGYREARGHAALTAAILWGALAIAFAIPGDRFVTGDLKGADFVYFYTLGRIAFDGPYPRAADSDYLYARQVELVPASEGDRHLSVYPPTAAIVFRPLASLPYGIAVILWAVITIIGYAVAVFLVWRQARDVLPDRRFIALSAAAFPPFWTLVLYGQTSVIPLLAFTLAWLAFRGGQPVAAGAAIGLCAIKPQFAIVFGVVLVVSWHWRALAGVFLSVAAQIGVVVLTMGSQALLRYAETLQQLRSVQDLLEPYPYRMHSLRVLTDLLPNQIGLPILLALIAAIIVASVVIWRSDTALELRFSTVVMATLLINPHLFVYDMTVMAIPLLLVGSWVERHRPSWRRHYWQGVYALFVFLLFPTARLVYIQGSVLVMSWMFVRVARASHLAPARPVAC